jgi:uroporphyrinogen-III decarboxylase
VNGRERCLAAIRGETVDRVPVFPLLMFFSADRAGITYREYATSAPALAASQLLVRERFPVDAITACSDAFRVSADLGGEMAYPEDKPPYLVRPIVETASDLNGLGRPDPSAKGSRMADRGEAVRAMAGSLAASASSSAGWTCPAPRPARSAAFPSS